MQKYFKLFLTLGCIVFFACAFETHLSSIILWVETLGAYSFFVFFIIYCIAVLLFLPVEPIVFSSGAIFGFYDGFLITLFSAVISAGIAFLITRYVGEGCLPPAKNKNIMRWLDCFESLGWKSLALFRLTPFVPCSIVNYGYGLTKIHGAVYMLTNIIFFIPYKLIVSYLGAQV